MHEIVPIQAENAKIPNTKLSSFKKKKKKKKNVVAQIIKERYLIL